MINHNRTVRRGFLLADALTGLILIAVLASALGGAIAWQNRSARKLADQREAVRLAERVLDDLQTNAPTTQPTSDARFEIRCTGDAATRDHQWVIVSATVRGRRAELVGLVPEKAAP